MTQIRCSSGFLKILFMPFLTFARILVLVSLVQRANLHLGGVNYPTELKTKKKSLTTKEKGLVKY